MFKYPDLIYRKLPSKVLFWFAAWVVWNVVLYCLSASVPEIKNAPKIPHFDKVAHFCYFMLGGFFLANAQVLKKIPWRQVVITTLVIGAIVGALDEYHQTFTPGRSGNDLGDWIADVSGSIAGIVYCFCMWRRIKSEEKIREVT